MKRPNAVDWRLGNEEVHFKKHGIAFADAAQVFLDPNRLEWLDERRDYGEERLLTTGVVDALLLTLVFTMHGNELAWIISARRASRKERTQYANRPV